jgi:hypothetical protein
LYSQIHAGISSDDGTPSAQDMIITPKLSVGGTIALWSFLITGVATVICGATALVRHFI